jgi:hypothetical protein
MAVLLYLSLVCLIILLTVLVEGVVLTWLKWASFGQSLVSALAANLISTFAIGFLLFSGDQPRYSNLLVGWIVSSLIETVILHFFRRQLAWRTLISATLANLVSYLILILPAYYFGQRG